MMKILYGAGKYGRKALDYYGMDNVYAFCDGRTDISDINGKQMLSYDQFKQIAGNYEVVVTVADEKAIWDICSSLDEDGIKYTLFLDDIEEEREGIALSEMFSDIYETGAWGGTGWYSGSGSRTGSIIEPYIKLISNLIRYNNIHSICEIGCGDYYIMRQVLSDLVDEEISYVGIDVVPNLIKRNNDVYGNNNVSFIAGDATDSKFIYPEADILIIRQVLQHLDNISVMKILEKSNKYPFVLVTEHIYKGNDAVYNVDKVSGPDIRLRKKSGIYIEKEPFDIKNTVHLLEIPEGEGMIRTSLVMNDVLKPVEFER